MVRLLLLAQNIFNIALMICAKSNHCSIIFQLYIFNYSHRLGKIVATFWFHLDSLILIYCRLCETNRITFIFLIMKATHKSIRMTLNLPLVIHYAHEWVTKDFENIRG